MLLIFSYVDILSFLSLLSENVTDTLEPWLESPNWDFMLSNKSLVR